MVKNPPSTQETPVRFLGWKDPLEKGKATHSSILAWRIHDCSHKIKRCLLLGRKAMTNLDSIFKSRDIALPTKVHLVKAMVFPVVMYGCESWTVKKAAKSALFIGRPSLIRAPSTRPRPLPHLLTDYPIYPSAPFSLSGPLLPRP